MQLYVLLALLGIVGSQPVRPSRRPMENPDLFQGDITGMNSLLDRNGMPLDQNLWPNGVIPYVIESSVKHFNDKILQAMKHIESKTCIRFTKRTDQKDFIRIYAGEGCTSDWGRKGGAQPISLAKECENVAIIIHELNHAIGFLHEQNRSDRDDYIEIFWDNIEDGKEDQFFQLMPSIERLFDKFDYDSLMLYGETAFSIDGFSKTMTAKKKGVKLRAITDKGKLSSSDIFRIGKLYDDCRKKY